MLVFFSGKFLVDFKNNQVMERYAAHTKRPKISIAGLKKKLEREMWEEDRKLLPYPPGTQRPHETWRFTKETMAEFFPHIRCLNGRNSLRWASRSNTVYGTIETKILSRQESIFAPLTNESPIAQTFFSIVCLTSGIHGKFLFYSLIAKTMVCWTNAQLAERLRIWPGEKCAIC